MEKEQAAPQKKAKKLTLNADTLKNLDETELENVAGGATTTFRCTCTHGCSSCNPCA